jgi:hypothetical protein
LFILINNGGGGGGEACNGNWRHLPLTSNVSGFEAEGVGFTVENGFGFRVEEKKDLPRKLATVPVYIEGQTHADRQLRRLLRFSVSEFSSGFRFRFSALGQAHADLQLRRLFKFEGLCF